MLRCASITEAQAADRQIWASIACQSVVGTCLVCSSFALVLLNLFKQLRNGIPQLFQRQSERKTAKAER